MLLEKKHIHVHSIVIIGDFNPIIFHPEWFSKNGLIPSSEAEAAKIKVVHRDITLFNLEWLNFELTRERFKVSTSNEAMYEPLRDLVIGVFRLLSHTPLKMLGINNEIHFQIPVQETLDFFDVLSPSSYWNGVLDEPYFGSILMREERKEGLPGFLGIKIEASGKVEGGLFFQFNDHYQVKNEGTKVLDAKEILTTLESKWQKSFDNCFTLIDKMWQLKNETRKK